MGKIEKAVARIHEECGNCIPIDVEAIAERYCLTIVRQPLEPAVSGMLVVKGDEGTIGVNEAHHLHRQRFTVAHEIGHYFLHRSERNIFLDTKPIFYRDEASTEGSNIQEKEANIFAAQLLMPKELLSEYMLKEEWFDPMDEVSLRRLASHFGVSTQSMLIRLTKLDMISG